jgi:cellulose biosynthesis protein BcsQ
VEVSGNNNLLLLPGHIGLAEYETTLGIAQELSGSLLALRNLPGSIRFLLNETAVKYDVDFVLVDMSPSLGPLNQNSSPLAITSSCRCIQTISRQWR